MNAPDHDARGREDELAEVLAEALEVLDRGDTVDVQELCRGREHLAEIVEAALGRRGGLPQVHRAATTVDPAVGVELAGRYRIEERIGAGAMGAVYRGLDRELQRTVAIKLLRPELVVGQRLDARLAREGEVLASIRDRGVVTVYDRGQASDGRTFLVMELLDGHSGAELLRLDEDGGPFASGALRLGRFRRLLGDEAVDADSDVRQVVRWIADAAAGLHAAHAAGVVHRDVKPSNLFFERAGRVVVLDFGIVSIGSHVTLGVDDSPLGTPAFMAPEQLDPRREPDARTDVYGLAATLYHFLTGHAPYSGSPQQVLAALAQREPVPADRVRPGLPRDLVAVVEKGMARRPDDRYATAAELRQDLLAWLDFRPVTARRASPITNAWRRARRSPFARGAAAVALVVAITAAAWSWREAALARDGEEWWGLFATVPPSLLASPASYRPASAVTDSASVRVCLDRMVELDVHPVVARTLRALHRSDRGDLVGAAADMRAVAEVADVPFASTAAAEYADDRLPDALAAKVSDELRGGVDNRFVIAAHALRAGKYEEASAVLGGVALEHPGHEELRLLVLGAMCEKVLPARKRFVAYREILDGARRLEERRGLRTAVSCYLRGNASMGLSEVGDAIAPLESARELAPDDFSLVITAGNAASAAADFERAEGHYRAAIALQPASSRGHEGLFRCQLLRGELDAAEQTFHGTPFPDDLHGRIRQNRAEGLLLFTRAMAVRASERAAPSGDTRSVELAEQAKAAFARIPTFGRRSFPAIACDLMLDPRPALVDELLEAWSRDPLDVATLEHIAVLLAGPLTDAQVQQLGTVLRGQVEALKRRDH